MAETLNKEALNFLKSNTHVFAEVAKYMDVTPDTLITMIRKKSKSLNTYKGVLIIAEAMNKKPEDILEKVD